MLFRSKERGARVKERTKNDASKREGVALFGSRFISCTAKSENIIPLLGLSLLRKQTETLVTQASVKLVYEKKLFLSLLFVNAEQKVSCEF